MDALLLALTVLVWIVIVAIFLGGIMMLSYIASMTQLVDAKAANEKRLHT